MSLIEEYGFRPQFYYHNRGHVFFHRGRFCRTYLFQHVGCGNLGKRKDYNYFSWSDKNLVYVSAEASGSRTSHISFS